MSEYEQRQTLQHEKLDRILAVYDAAMALHEELGRAYPRVDLLDAMPCTGKLAECVDNLNEACRRAKEGR